MKPLSEILIPIEEDTSSFKTETTPIKVEVPVVNKTVETNITDGAEINKQAVQKVQNVSDYNYSNTTITDSTPDGFFKTAIRTSLNTPLDFLKNFIVGAGGTAQELYYAEKAEGEVIFDKGLGEYIKETRKEVIDYYKQKGLKDIAEETGLRYKGSSVVDDSQPDIIARLMPNMAKLRDESYLGIGQDVAIDENNVKINDIAVRENDFTEKRKLHAEKVVKWMVQTNDTIQSVLDKTGLPKNEKDGLKYDLLGTPSQVLMSLIPLYIFKKPKLIAGAYAFMQKAQTTINQYKLGDTAEDALMIGNKTATFSGIAEMVELSVFKKWFFAPEVKNAVKQTYMEAMKQFYKTKGIALWGKSILNEAFTGAVQEIGNIYIPEKYGKSNGQTFLENLYQIGVASAMEGLGGAMGSTPFVVHHSLNRMAFNMGMKAEEAKALADDLTSIVSQQAEQMRDSFVKEVTKEMTPEEQTKLANEITTEIEKVKTENIQEEEIPVGIKGALFGKVQNQEQADAMAEVLQSTNFLNQKVSGVETDALVNNETQSIQLSDLENLSYLSDVLSPEQTQEQIVNNASNLFLETTLKARQTEVGKQSGVVSELDALIGKPTDNKYSQEQKAKLQEEFYNYLITGKAKSTSQKNLFNGMKSQLSRTYYKLSEKNMLDDKTENAYRALTKELNPKLEPIEINEQAINDLKEEITNLRNGKPTSVKKIEFINQMIKFGQTYQDTKATEEDVKLWNLYADTYKKLFGNQVNLNQVKGAIEMLDQKGFFVFDETKYNSLLDNLVNAKKKLEKVVRTDLNDMKNKFNAGLSTLNTMLNKLEDLGISSKNLNDSVLNIDPNSTTSEQLLKGIDQIEEALFQTRKLLNNKYISSEYYKISKKDFEKPIINSGNIRTRIETTIADFVVGKNYEELQSDIENNSLELTKKIAKDLKVFDAEIQNKIKNTLLKSKTVNDIYTGIDKILDDIETKINKDYVKKINKKIKEQLKEIKSNANNGVMTYNDNIFFKNIFNFVKTFKDSIPDILAIEMDNKIRIDNGPLFSEDINFANEQISKLKEKLTDDLSTDESKVIKKDIEMWQGVIKSVENGAISKYINTGVDFNQFSKNGDKQPFALDERQISLAKSFMQYLYNEYINNNDAVDNLYDLYKNLESFSKASMEEQNVKILEKQNWLRTKTTEIVDYLGKLKVLPAYPLFLKTFADINNFMSLAFGQKFSDEFSTIQAETEANLMFNKAKNKLDMFIKKMVNTDKYGYAFSLMKSKPFSESKNKILKEMDMNKAEALYFYIQSLNPKGLIAVLNAVERDGLTEIESILSNEDKRIGKYMSDVLVELYPQINEVYETRFNKPMGKENVFFPIKYKYDTQSEQIEEVGDFGKSIFNEIIINNPSFIKSRTNSQRALDKRNPFTIFERYVQDASMYVHITPILNNLLSILEFGKDSIKKVMIPKIGDSAYNTLETLIKGIQGTLETNNISHLSGESKLNEFVNNVILSKVMGKLFTSYKQLFGIVNFAEVMPVKDFSKHLSYAYTHPSEVLKEMFTMYPQLQDRYEHSINDPIVQKIVDIDRSFKGVQKIKEYSTWSIRAFDMISSVSGAYAYTKYLESLGKYSPEEIKTKVINQVWSSQGSSLKSTTDLLSMSEKRPLMKALNAFRINQKQFFRKSVMAVHDYYNGKISLEQATKTLSIYLVINPVLYGIASMPVTAWTVFNNLDDEDEREELYKLVIRPIINNITSIGPILEFITMPIIDEFAKGLGYKSYKPLGGLKPLMFYDVMDGGVTMLKLAFGKTHDSTKTLEGILGGLQPLTAVPLVPASRIVTGVYNIAEGEFLKAIANIANMPKSEMKKFIDD